MLFSDFFVILCKKMFVIRNNFVYLQKISDSLTITIINLLTYDEI